MDLVTLRSFVDEMTKIAELSPELQKFENKLQRGDILVTQRRSPGTTGTVIDKVLSAFQGGAKYTHSAMYVGDGKVIDSVIGQGVKSRDLEDYAGRYKLRALRVKAPRGMKERAVTYAKAQVGKDYDLYGTLRQALPARADIGKRVRQEVENLNCSQLIANAYHQLALGKKRFISDVRPIDLQRSLHTKVIGEHA